MNKIDREKAVRFIKSFGEYLCADYDTFPTVFRNKSSCHASWYHRNGEQWKGQLIFGYEEVNRVLEKGFLDYKTVRKIWHNESDSEFRVNDGTGLKALWAAVLHESTHIHVQAEYDLQVTSHGEEYQERLYQNIQDYPFPDIREKANRNEWFETELEEFTHSEAYSHIPIQNARWVPEYKYLLKCTKCGQEAKYKRKTKYIKFPQLIKCASCGGQFKSEEIQQS